MTGTTAVAVTDAVIGSSLVPLVDLNPFHWLGDAAKEGVADGFTAMMMSLWSAALWLLRAVFGLLDHFVTPRLDDPGLSHLYGVTVSISAVIAFVIALGQVALTAIRREGRHLATLVAGLAQYGAVLTMWIGVSAALVLGCAGLSQVLLDELLDVGSFSGYAAGTGWVDHVSGTVEAAVLGVCALFLLIPASLGYLLIMLAREAALLVLVATLPIAAAGALGESTKAWMWKSVRWFLAACFTAPLLALVLGLGVQISQAALPEAGSAAQGTSASAPVDRSDQEPPAESSVVPPGVPPEVSPDLLPESEDADVPDTASNVGLAVVGCVITLVGCFCPMALFRLLAFVDPGTGSGASFRSALAANGGFAGLMSSRREPTSSGTSSTTSAQVTDENGQSAGEASAEAETTSRYSRKLAGLVPAAGRAAGGVLSTIGGVAAQGAALGVDVMGQAGVGHQGYFDTTPQHGRGRGHSQPVRTRTGHPEVPDHAEQAEDHDSRSAVPDVGVPRSGTTPLGNTGAGLVGGPAGGSTAADAAFLA